MALTTGILLVFTGMMIPRDIFPPIIQGFGDILPITNGISVIRSAFSGTTLSDVYLILLREAFIGVGYLVLGLIGFTLFERIAKQTGALEKEVYG